MNILLILAANHGTYTVEFDKYPIDAPTNDINNKPLIIIFLIIYLVGIVIVTRMGSKRAIGALRSFFISLILTPLVGFFIVSLSSTTIISISHHRKSRVSSPGNTQIYKCSSCGYKYNERLDICPLCGKAKTIKED